MSLDMAGVVGSTPPPSPLLSIWGIMVLNQAHFGELSDKLKDTRFRNPLSGIPKNGIGGNRMQRYLLSLKNKKAIF